VIARETDISTLTRLLYIAYFLEVGLILLFVPWSVFWERNFFAESLPLVHAVVKNNFVRGAISGIGVLNLLAGLVDLRTLIPWERR
jgi:hypothetical protein